MREVILGVWLLLSEEFKLPNEEISDEFNKECEFETLKGLMAISIVLLVRAAIPKTIFTKYREYLGLIQVLRHIIPASFVFVYVNIFSLLGKRALPYKDEILSINPYLKYFFPKPIDKKTEEKTIDEKTEENTIENQLNNSIQAQVATKEILEEKEIINNSLWDMRFGDAEYREKLAYKYFVYNLNKWIDKDKEENKPYSDELWGNFIFVTALMHICSLSLVYKGNFWSNKPFEAQAFWIFQFPILNVIALAGVAYFNSGYRHYLELMGIKYESQILKFEPGLKKRFMINSTKDN
ncbi:unnamed protein product [Blepharisma stoltei]|uniref:Uncharacterized protein n=1 Tax=Blepharisma stoltei TaxID=1481888 RepID=A0AAU9JN66_9CILI|nr:unnamed protein product [Blepharisma stoltei]